MRILFIYSNINVRAGNFGKYPAMQIGIASISSLLKKHGHGTKLVLVSKPDEFETILKQVQDYKPDIIGYTAVTSQFEYITGIAKHVREKHPGLFQICGGYHTTLSKDSALNNQPFDAICIGEGEFPMLELTEKFAAGADITGIENLYVKTNHNNIKRNSIRPYNQKLDELPFIDRDLFKEYVDLGKYPHSILTTRGCYFNCSYCCNHALRSITTGSYVRSRSIKNVIEEIEMLVRRWPTLNYLYIEDETIGQNRKYWEQLLNLLQQTTLRFGTNYRIGVTSLDFLDSLRQANFVKINIGIESGNEFIRKKILNRKYSNEQIVDTFHRAKKLGMLTKSYNLIGLPHETPEMFEDTIRINKIVQPDDTMLNIFYPYPGTKLDRICDDLGLKANNQNAPIRERTESILNLPAFPEDELMTFFNNWNKSIRGNILQRAKRVIRKRFKQVDLYR